MPRKRTAGTFDGAPAYRWKRMINGTVWRLLCRAQRDDETAKPNTGYLGLPEADWTKERSQKAANEWWDRMLPEISGTKPSPAMAAEFAAAIQDRLDMLEWLQSERPDDPLIKTIRSELADIERERAAGGCPPMLPATWHRSPIISFLRVGADDLPPGTLPIPMIFLRGRDDPEGVTAWEQRIETVRKHKEWSGKAATEPDKRLSAVMDRYLSLQRSKVAARSGGSPATVDNIRRYLAKFIAHLGPETSVESINAKIWEQWFVWVAGQTDWSQSSRRDLLVTSRSFVEWCWKQELI